MRDFYQRHKNVIWLCCIVLFALLCRVLRYYECELLERDSFAYIKMGKLWAAEGVGAAYLIANNLYYSAPPLLPAIMALGELCGIGAQNAGLWFNLLSGALIPLALYIICRAVFEDQRYALWAALLGAIHPYTLRLSALIMRDTPYIAAVMFAVACGVWAVKTRKMWLWLLFALFAVMASLLRKEGFELIFVFGCWSLWSLWQRRVEWKTEFPYLLKAGVCILIIFCAGTLPLQVYMKKNSECTWGVVDPEWMTSMYHKVIKADFSGEYEDKKKH